MKNFFDYFICMITHVDFLDIITGRVETTEKFLGYIRDKFDVDFFFTQLVNSVQVSDDDGIIEVYEDGELFKFYFEILI